MKTKCSHCNSIFQVADSSLGKKGKCPKCQKIFVVEDCQKGDPPPQAQPQRAPHASSATQEEQSDTYGVSEPTKQCPLCGETILEVAKKCKHCGEQLTLPTNPVASVPRRATRRVKRTSRRGALTLLIGGAGIVAVSVFLTYAIIWIGNASDEAEERRSEESIQKAKSFNPASYLPLDLEQLWHDVSNNSVRADAKWIKRKVYISGPVSSISSNSINIYKVSDGPDGILITCDLAQSGKGKIMSLNTGDQVKVYGRISRLGISQIMLYDCEIQKEKKEIDQ